MSAIWQGNYPGPLGHKNPDGTQGTIPNEGCVLCAGTAAHNLWTDLPPMTPREVNDLLLTVPGAFVDGHGHAGDMLHLPVACPPLHLVCDPDDKMVGGDNVPTDPNRIKHALVEAFLDAKINAGGRGGAFVRVEVTGGKKPFHHTILGCVNATGLVECLDSACPGQQGGSFGWTILSLSTLQEASPLRWGDESRSYRVVGVRAVRRA